MKHSPLSAAAIALAISCLGAGAALASDIGAPGGKPARTIEVTVQDNYFTPGSFQIAQGETIRFVIKNAGQLVHEFNIGTAEMHASHQSEMQMMVDHGVLEPEKINHAAMKMKMPDGSTMEHDYPNSVLLEPGKTAEIVWTFSGADTLEIACNIPGHYDSGMMASIDR